MEHAPSGGAERGNAPGEGGRPLTIGAVLDVLLEEFPEVIVSKIRFLEPEGLVEPGGTPSGYRKFDFEDIRRLSFVLRMQCDHYLPLRVVGEHLEALKAGGQPTQPHRHGEARMVRAELSSAAHVTVGRSRNGGRLGSRVPMRKVLTERKPSPWPVA